MNDIRHGVVGGGPDGISACRDRRPLDEPNLYKHEGDVVRNFDRSQALSDLPREA